MSYSKAFFIDLALGAEKSAEAVVPVVYHELRPISVLDVGCGTGSWLKVWQAHGADIFGIDGDWVDTNNLDIPQANFKKVDLEQPFALQRRFDLVTCLEVAEHVHETSAKHFVASLAQHSDTILFSAAVPWQGGTDHFNEQWPPYWIELFAEHDFVFLDPFRYKIWNNAAIKDHYRQNMLLFVHKNRITGNAFFEAEKQYADRSLVSVVHPAKFIKAKDPAYRSLRYELPVFFQMVKNFVRNRFRRSQ